MRKLAATLFIVVTLVACYLALHPRFIPVWTGNYSPLIIIPESSAGEFWVLLSLPRPNSSEIRLEVNARGKGSLVTAEVDVQTLTYYCRSDRGEERGLLSSKVLGRWMSDAGMNVDASKDNAEMNSLLTLISGMPENMQNPQAPHLEIKRVDSGCGIQIAPFTGLSVLALCLLVAILLMRKDIVGHHKENA